MPVVCLPTEHARDLVGELPASVEVVVWSGVGARPDRLDETEFWVPEFAWGSPEDRRRTIESLPRLRVVQTLTAGVDTVRAVIPDHVTLCDGRGIHGSSTSEWILTAILASLREIPRFVLARSERRWDYGVTDELAGKNVLVIGAGDIGENTARRLRAFDAVPVMVARTKREGVFGVDELPDLLPAADVVVLIVPKTDATVGLVDAEFLASMRDGALLVNAARGPVVDTDALVAELQSGRLFAAVDVTDPEPLPHDHPLWTVPNLLLTPHVAGTVLGFPARAYALAREQILRYAAGEPLINVVDGDY